MPENPIGNEGMGPGGARSAPPAFTRPIHPKPHTESCGIGKVPFLPRSELACWWSIMHLIRTEPEGTVWFWTFTSPCALPLWWFAERHAALVNHVNMHAKRQVKSSHGGTIPKNWGGVRVFETNPNGTGYHAHWVVRGYYDWSLMQKCALAAGLGKVVWVEPKPATEKTAYYLAMYLQKDEGLKGTKKWANIGTYDGIGKRDIEQTSERIEWIKKRALMYRTVHGKHRLVAYRLACADADDRKAIDRVPF